MTASTSERIRELGVDSAGEICFNRSLTTSLNTLRNGFASSEEQFKVTCPGYSNQNYLKTLR